MKKIIVILFLFLSLNVAYGSDYIPADTKFTLNLWFNSDYTYPESYYWKSIVTIDGPNSIHNDLFVVERDRSSRDCYDFKVNSWSSVRFFKVCIPDGVHMLTVSYGLGLDALYIDGVAQFSYYSVGGSSQIIEGNVVLSNDVIPGSFTYIPDVVSSSQVKSLLNFGEPGTIKYQINLLFWEVIKHFRSFF